MDLRGYIWHENLEKKQKQAKALALLNQSKFACVSNPLGKSLQSYLAWLLKCCYQIQFDKKKPHVFPFR